MALIDGVAEGPQFIDILHSVIQGDNPGDGGAYDGLQVRSLTVEVVDADSAAVTLTPLGTDGSYDGNTLVAEAGNFAVSDRYSIALSKAPAANKTVTVTLSHDDQINSDRLSVTFNSSNWNTPQEVEIRANNDNVREGLHYSTIIHTVTSSDAAYNGLAVDSIEVRISDDDAPGVLIEQSGGTTEIREAKVIEVKTGTTTGSTDTTLTGDFAVGSNLDIARVNFTTTVFDRNNTLTRAIINEVEANNTVDTAMDLDAYDWSLRDDVNIGDRYRNTSRTIPHITIRGTGNDSYDWYTFTVANAGDRGIFDIDNGMPDVDTYLRLYNAAGNLITLNDDRDPSAGQGGSSHRYDAFLEHKFAASGDYYLKVSKYYDQEVPLSTDYDLNISLTNHPLWSTVPVTYNSSSGGELLQMVILSAAIRRN